MPALNALAVVASDDGRAFAERVHFVHVYVIEPHPAAPDPSPYSGRVWEARYSTKRQPTTYGERMTAARETRALLTGPQLTVVDDLTPGRLANPMWCTYGTCPNCAFLIRQDGIIDTVQTWLDVPAMERAMQSLLSDGPAGR